MKCFNRDFNDMPTITTSVGARNLMKLFGHCILASSIVFSVASAVAQEVEKTEEEKEADLERIVVTVERRSQDIQDLGGTAFAFSGEDLKAWKTRIDRKS